MADGMAPRAAGFAVLGSIHDFSRGTAREEPVGDVLFHSAIRRPRAPPRAAGVTMQADMDHPGRREFLTSAFTAGLAVTLGRPLSAATSPVRRRMTIDLICGNLGVKATQREAIDLARRHGFESVFPDAGELARLSDAEVQALLADLKAAGLVFGAAFL